MRHNCNPVIISVKIHQCILANPLPLTLHRLWKAEWIQVQLFAGNKEVKQKSSYANQIRLSHSITILHLALTASTLSILMIRWQFFQYQYWISRKKKCLFRGKLISDVLLHFINQRNTVKISSLVTVTAHVCVLKTVKMCQIFSDTRGTIYWTEPYRM